MTAALCERRRCAAGVVTIGEAARRAVQRGDARRALTRRSRPVPGDVQRAGRQRRRRLRNSHASCRGDACNTRREGRGAEEQLQLPEGGAVEQPQLQEGGGTEEQPQLPWAL